MKMLYATSIQLPSSLANRTQILATAHEFAKILGSQFILGIGKNSVQNDLGFPYIETGIRIKSYALAWTYIRYARKEHITHIYSREERLLFWMIVWAHLLRFSVFFCYESHHLYDRHTWWYRFLLRNTTRIVTLTHASKQIFEDLRYPAQHIAVAPDAVDQDFFDIPLTKIEARRILELPSDRPIAVYAGTIEGWKGVNGLYESAILIPEYLFVILGGRGLQLFMDEHTSRKNFLMIGQQDRSKVPTYFKAADVLVLPNTGMDETSVISTSPMKLFEYMAAERPIVASDLPSLREILHEGNAFLVTPDDPAALAAGIRHAVEETEKASSCARQAREDVRMCTWENRARRILSFIADKQTS